MVAELPVEYEELPTEFEMLYETILGGDTVAALVAADLCEEEGDMPCALALRSFATEVKFGRRCSVELRRTDEETLWVRAISCGKETRYSRFVKRATMSDTIHAALESAKAFVMMYTGEKR